MRIMTNDETMKTRMWWKVNEPNSVRRAKLTREISSPPIDFSCAMMMMWFCWFFLLFFQSLPQTIISKSVTLPFEDIPS